MNPDHEAWRARVRATWDARAARWLATSERNRGAPDREPDLDRTIAALGIRPGDRVLDAGCGTGQWAIDLALRGFEVAAVDLSPAAIEIAQSRAAGEPGLPPIDWRAGDLASPVGPADAFDAVICRGALQFVPDVSAALREFRRVLRPGGRLLAGVPGALSPIYRHSWERHLHAELPEVNLITPWELETLLTETGWRVLDGWGDYGPSASGAENPFDPAQLATLDRRLQQAAATGWATVAE